MIAGEIKNIGLYKGISANFSKAVDYIQNHDLSKVEDGKIVIDRDEVFAMVNHFITQPLHERKWEAHYKYIDIQCILEGRETIGFTNVSSEIMQLYSPENDIVFYNNGTCGESLLNLTAGMFAAFFTNEAHKPCCINGDASRVKKVVFKVKA